jgi:hypothetical protein
MGYRLAPPKCATSKQVAQSKWRRWRSQAGDLQSAPPTQTARNQTMQETLGTYGFAPLRHLRHPVVQQTGGGGATVAASASRARSTELPAAHGRLAPTAGRPCARLPSWKGLTDPSHNPAYRHPSRTDHRQNVPHAHLADPTVMQRHRTTCPPTPMIAPITTGSIVSRQGWKGCLERARPAWRVAEATLGALEAPYPLNNSTAGGLSAIQTGATCDIYPCKSVIYGLKQNHTSLSGSGQVANGGRYGSNRGRYGTNRGAGGVCFRNLAQDRAGGKTTSLPISLAFAATD